MKSVFWILLIVVSLVACSPEAIQSVSPLPNTPTTAPKITQTIQPSQTPTLVIPTETLTLRLAAEATISAFGTMCKPPTSDWTSTISPDGNWITRICRGENGKDDSYLQIVNIQKNKNWIIRHADYTKRSEDDTDGMIYPFHWSVDGKYVYVNSPSRGSGCCWIGWDLLLIRLNLENGEQKEIANYIGQGLEGVNFSISPSENYVLYIPQDDTDNLYILNINNWKKRVIKLEHTRAGAGYTLMSNDDSKVVLVLRNYPKEFQGDLTFGSLVVIDLKSGQQRKLLSDIQYEEMPIPISWQDNYHVLLQSNDKYWLLNINTAELTEIEKPQPHTP